MTAREEEHRQKAFTKIKNKSNAITMSAYSPPKKTTQFSFPNGSASGNYGRPSPKQNGYKDVPPNKVDKCSGTMTSITGLDDLYEKVLVLERKVETAPSRSLMDQYERALNNFNNLYSVAPTKLQEEWLPTQPHIQAELGAMAAKRTSFSNSMQSLQNQGGNFTGTYFVTTWEDEKNTYTRLEYLQQTGVTYDVLSGKMKKENHQLTVRRYTLGEDHRYQIQRVNHKLGTSKDEMQCIMIMRQLNLQPFHTVRETETNKNYKYLKRFNDGIGPWYVTVKSPKGGEEPQPEVIDIPDWCDHGFEDILKKFQEECSGNILTIGRSAELKQQMSDALKEQQASIDKLMSEYSRGNDGVDELAEVWQGKRNSYLERLDDLKKTASCLDDQQECTDYTTLKKEYDDRCNLNSLPASRAGDLIDGMIDCLDDSDTEIDKREQKLRKAGTLGISEKAQFAKERNEVQVKRDAISGYSRDGCMDPVDLTPKFKGGTNKILNESEIRQVIEDDVMPFLLKDPDLRLVITGHTGSSKRYDDQVYSGEGTDEEVYAVKTGAENKGGTSLGDYHNTGIDATVMTNGTLMDLRGGAVLNILTRSKAKDGFGLDPSRIMTVQRGTHLPSSSNRRVTIEFY